MEDLPTTTRNGSTSAWRKIRAQVLDEEGYVCGYCGSQANTVDHIIPLAKGGSDDRSNLISACGACNYSKRDKILGMPEQMSEGVFSPDRATPRRPVHFLPEARQIGQNRTFVRPKGFENG